MNSHDDIETKKLLVGMRNYEKLLCEIYSSFSKIFNEHKSFWQDISVDENTHALMADTFISLYDDGDMSFSERTFQYSIIEKDVAKLLSFQKEIEKREINIQEAVKFALSAENSIIERDLFKTKDSDPPEFKKLLTALYEDSKKHYLKISEFYQNIKAIRDK